MKISFNWLKDYIAIKCSADELAQKLTMAGLEVEFVSRVKNDTVFEIEITPNRPDCLNILGVAREISAILNKDLKYPRSLKINFPKKVCDLTIEDQEGCRRYMGTVMENVQVKASSKMIQERLDAVGLRTISNIVDITNFCMMEYGQPLHAFDYDKLAGHKIIVRRARKGEKIITIDNIERELDESILVIADEKKPVAIAGIMGGKETEVTQKTKNILLESAYFDPIVIRRASRKLGLSTDSSYRFERGVDIQTVKSGSDRAMNLILENSGGTIVAHKDAIVTKAIKTVKPIEVSINAVNQFLGSVISQKQCATILKRLECAVSLASKDVLKVTPPSFRLDIIAQVDVIEEIARIYGYNNIPSSLSTIKAVNIPEYQKRQKREQVREIFIAQGFCEVITYTLMSRKALENSGQKDLENIRILNPLSQEQEIMRPSLLPSLLPVVLSNINKNEKDLKLFELGKVYGAKEEKDTLAFIMTGKRSVDWRQAKKEDVNFYDMKGAIEQMFHILGIKDIVFKALEKGFLQNAQQAEIFCHKKFIGYLGKIEKGVLDSWDIKQSPIFYAELCLEDLYPFIVPQHKFLPLCEYPGIVYDISLAIEKHISFDEVKAIIWEYGKDILTQVVFKEEYCGEKIPDGYRGIIFSLTYQSRTKTLTESEVNAIHDAINRELVHRLKAIKR